MSQHSKIQINTAATRTLSDGRTLYVVRKGDYFARFVEDPWGNPQDPITVSAQEWLKLIFTLEQQK